MFIFLDTETTGTGPDDRLCQIAFKPEVGKTVNQMFNPGTETGNEEIVTGLQGGFDDLKQTFGNFCGLIFWKAKLILHLFDNEVFR